MNTQAADAAFQGSIPQVYDRLLVPIIFEPYAVDLCRRVAASQPADVLELAAGTGVVTRQLARELPPSVRIVATDLNQAMLDQAIARGTHRPVEWKQADAMKLPFDDASFDAVVAQFGVMFFPDKAAALAEARRVLRPGGRLVFNLWGRIEDNDFIRVVTRTLDARYPANPPRFMHRGPHGYTDPATITRDLAAAGFANPEITIVDDRSRAPSAREPAVGYCQGNPMRAEIEAQGPGELERATQACMDALVAEFGTGEVDGALRAIVVSASR